MEGLPGASKKELKDAPAFIRQFSRETDPKGRQVVAEHIRDQRRMKGHAKEMVKARGEQVAALNRALDEYNSGSYVVKVLDYFKMKKVRESLKIAKQEREETSTIFRAYNSNEQNQKYIDSFYEREKRRWAETPYSKEEVSALFTEEHLASLSTEEYGLLMRRFPSEMVTHVTRQGIRDHNGMAYHFEGKSEFHDGFEKMLETGRLHAPLAVALAEAQKQDALIGLIGREVGGPPQNRKQALEALDRELYRYPDRNAAHFAAEEVADHFYGSERGNEIFVAYPSAFIASQYRFQNRLTAGNETMHNDVSVWDKEQKGMDLDAGLVFIPKDARVDAATGSRYHLTPDKEPKPNEAIPLIKQWINRPEFVPLAERMTEALAGIHESDIPSPDAWDSLKEHSFKTRGEKVAETMIPLREELKAMGITDVRLQSALLSYGAFFSFAIGLGKDDAEHAIEEAIDSLLEQEGIRFVEAKDAISSEEYWERYFAKHPDRRPSKIIYYKGADPSLALRVWKKQNGLSLKAEDETLGFAEHQVNGEHPAAQQGKGRFESLVREAIDREFPAGKAGVVD